MKRTLFSKFFVMITAALILTFTITGLSLYLYLQVSLSANKVLELKRGAEQIGELYNEYLQFNGNVFYKNLFNQSLNSVEQNTGALVMITDRQGRLMEWTRSINAIVDGLIYKDNSYFLPDPRQYENVVNSGEDIKTSGDFYGLFRQYGNDILTVAVLKKAVFFSGEDYFIVYLSVRMPEVYVARKNAMVMYSFWGSLAICTILVIVYFLTKRITKPIKEMSLITRAMAKGEMGQRVSTLPKDEVGQLARNFNAMADALENLEKMRRDFVANVSHELRTPMTSMRGFIDAILDGTVPLEERDKYLMIVRDQTVKLSNLVNELLDLSRIQYGKIDMNISNFDINELIRQTAATMEALFVQRDIEFVFNQGDRSTVLFLQGDRSLVERVIINLLSNALKFTRGRIEITTWEKDKFAFVKVSDNGHGIDQAELPHVFDRFYKSDKSRSADSQGTGLGLFIAREIVVSHGGHIEVHSEKGLGTDVVFGMPLKI